MVSNCPECEKGELKENISFEGTLLWIKKVITIYCTSCGYKNTIRLPSSITEKQVFEENRRF
jgi:C4-type Zn-finger protein